MATDQQQITLKIFVNKTKNCVAFVESDLDFVDVLLSFLTLPVGTVVRLLNKQSSLGCFDKLYQSVEQLDEKYLVTAACRSMLTNPVNSSVVKCRKLRINIDEMGELYKCSTANCRHHTYSYYSGLKCPCDRYMNEAISNVLTRDDVNYEELHGVFIQGDKFVVTDSLCIAFVEDLISTLNECGSGDRNQMEERLVKIEREQVLHILKRSLISNTPLTDVLLHNGEVLMTTPKVSVPSIEKTVEKKAFDEEEKIYKLNMVLTCNKVLYAVASQDFVDLILSFLTFPLGSLKKHLGSRFRIGCLNNLYGSAERLRSAGYMVAGCEERLLNPKLAPYFNCKNQVIGVGEETQDIYFACSVCFCQLSDTCFYCKSCCSYSSRAALIDPKSQPRGIISSCGSYCQKLITYMVTDELVVTPLSLTDARSFRNEISEPIKMAELSVAEEEVLDFLAAALTSDTALTDAFLARTVGVFASVDEKGGLIGQKAITFAPSTLVVSRPRPSQWSSRRWN